eukprot:41515-Amphidinium_carterae.1
MSAWRCCCIVTFTLPFEERAVDPLVNQRIEMLVDKPSKVKYCCDSIGTDGATQLAQTSVRWPRAFLKSHLKCGLLCAPHLQFPTDVSIEAFEHPLHFTEVRWDSCYNCLCASFSFVCLQSAELWHSRASARCKFCPSLFLMARCISNTGSSSSGVLSSASLLYTDVQEGPIEISP